MAWDWEVQSASANRSWYIVNAWLSTPCNTLGHSVFAFQPTFVNINIFYQFPFSPQVTFIIFIMAHHGKEPRPFDPKFIFAGVEETSEEERTTHAASCHCGAVQFNVTLNRPFPSYPVNRCTCTICSSTGYLLVYPCRRDIEWVQGNPLLLEPGEISQLMLRKGYENLQDYVWNTKRVAHKFCKTCGTRIGVDFRFAEGGQTDPAKDIFAINVYEFFIHPNVASSGTDFE